MSPKEWVSWSVAPLLPLSSSSRKGSKPCRKKEAVLVGGRGHKATVVDVDDDGMLGVVGSRGHVEAGRVGAEVDVGGGV